MQHYLILQYPYEVIEIALCQNGTIVQSVTEHKFNAIKSTIPNIQALLAQHNLTLQDIAGIGVNVGPGPYNTLRAILTMANGINFAANVPLICCNALELLEKEIASENSLIIFHAFLDHVFYRLKIDDKITQASCSVKDLIILINQQKLDTKILTVGNGAQMHKTILLDQCKNLVFPEKIPAFNSLQTLAQETDQKIKLKHFENAYLKPIYFEDLA